jgi:hypothetical protein
VSELPVEAAPAVAEAAHEAAGGKVVYITEGGQRLAAIVRPTTPLTWLKISPTQKPPWRAVVKYPRHWRPGSLCASWVRDVAPSFLNTLPRW